MGCCAGGELAFVVVECVRAVLAQGVLGLPGDVASSPQDLVEVLFVSATPFVVEDAVDLVDWQALRRSTVTLGVVC